MVVVPVMVSQQVRHSRLEDETVALRARLENPAGPLTIQDRNERGGRQSSQPLALDEILALPDPAERIDQLLAFADSRSIDQLPGVLGELRGSAPEWDPEARMATHLLLIRWARGDPDAAFASLDSLDFKRAGGDPGSLLSSLAASDPARAAAWLDAPFNSIAYYPEMGHVLAGAISREWVRQDPEATLAWAGGLAEDRRAGAFVGTLDTVAASDPRSALLESGIREWSRLDPKAAREWITSNGWQEIGAE
jgi:hypothetical protein